MTLGFAGDFTGLAAFLPDFFVALSLGLGIFFFGCGAEALLALTFGDFGAALARARVTGAMLLNTKRAEYELMLSVRVLLYPPGNGALPLFDIV